MLLSADGHLAWTAASFPALFDCKHQYDLLLIQKSLARALGQGEI